MLSLTLQDLDETAAAAGHLRRALRSGDVILLSGEIGAGKTTFVRELAAALGTLEVVRSPTYTIAHSYRLADGGSLAHLDLYRDLGPMTAGAWTDLEPYLEGATCTCIEWPAAAADWLPQERTWQLRLQIVGDDSRVLRIQAPTRAEAVTLADRFAGVELVR